MRQPLVFLCLISCELRHIQFIVFALLREQLLVIADFRDLAMVHNHDFIRIPDRTQTVSNDQAGTVLHQTDHRVLDILFGTGVYRRRGLIQNQNLGIRQYGAGDGH